MRVARDRPLETRMDRGFRNVLNRIKNKGTPRWEVDQGRPSSRRSDQIKAWLHLNSDWYDRWLALDSDVRGPGVQDWPKELTDFAVFCCSDAGLTQFEADAIRARYLGRIASS